MTKTGIKQFCCSCLKAFNHLSDLGVKVLFTGISQLSNHLHVALVPCLTFDNIFPANIA